MPTTVGTSTSDYAVWYPIQRQSFHANGRFWVFYLSASEVMSYRTSTDGVAWSDLITVRTGIEAANWTIWFDGSYVHYFIWAGPPSNNIYYRRGTPDADGHITWSADEQTSGTAGGLFGCCVDSEGYPWITYVTTSPGFLPSVIKSSKNDGTWRTALGFPFQLYGSTQYPCPVPLTNGKVYVVYAQTSAKFYGRLWNGHSWEDEETISTSNTVWGPGCSIVAEGDDVHLVFMEDAGYSIVHIKRTYGVGWGGETTVQADANYPVLSIDGDGKLYCFWMNYPTMDHVFYKKYIDGTWDADLTDWIDETTDDIYADDRLSCHYGAYGGYIALIYMTKTESPYNVRHEYLSGLTEFTPVTVYPPVVENPLICKPLISPDIIKKAIIR